MSHHCTGGRLRALVFEQTVAVGLSRARLGENLFEWEQGQTHLPEQMKNERADLRLPGRVNAKGCSFRF